MLVITMWWLATHISYVVDQTPNLLIQGKCLISCFELSISHVPFQNRCVDVGDA